jgi:hypothetical protein
VRVCYYSVPMRSYFQRVGDYFCTDRSDFWRVRYYFGNIRCYFQRDRYYFLPERSYFQRVGDYFCTDRSDFWRVRYYFSNICCYLFFAELPASGTLRLLKLQRLSQIYIFQFCIVRYFVSPIARFIILCRTVNILRFFYH